MARSTSRRSLSTCAIVAVLTLLETPVIAQRLGAEFQVNVLTSDFQDSPSVAVSASGEFVVVWDTQVYGAGGFDIFARRFSSTGTALGSEFQVNTYTPAFQSYPSVSAEAGGDFVVVWSSELGDGSGDGVF